MSNFRIIPPLSIADLSQPRIFDADNVFWLFPHEALFSFWEIKSFVLQIDIRKVYGSQDISKTFTCTTFDENCVCAMPQQQRLLRTLDQPFFKAKCDFATLEIDGIFFKENPNTTQLEKTQFGFSTKFNFNWDCFYVSTSNDIPEEDVSETFSIGLAGTGANAYLRRPICDWYNLNIALTFDYF